MRIGSENVVETVSKCREAENDDLRLCIGTLEHL